MRTNDLPFAEVLCNPHTPSPFSGQNHRPKDVAVKPCREWKVSWCFGGILSPSFSGLNKQSRTLAWNRWQAEPWKDWSWNVSEDEHLSRTAWSGAEGVWAVQGVHKWVSEMLIYLPMVLEYSYSSFIHWIKILLEGLSGIEMANFYVFIDD